MIDINTITIILAIPGFLYILGWLIMAIGKLKEFFKEEIIRIPIDEELAFRAFERGIVDSIHNDKGMYYVKFKSQLEATHFSSNLYGHINVNKEEFEYISKELDLSDLEFSNPKEVIKKLK